MLGRYFRTTVVVSMGLGIVSAKNNRIMRYVVWKAVRFEP